jgi:hypothetical protein
MPVSTKPLQHQPTLCCCLLLLLLLLLQSCSCRRCLALAYQNF